MSKCSIEPCCILADQPLRVDMLLPQQGCFRQSHSLTRCRTPCTTVARLALSNVRTCKIAARSRREDSMAAKASAVSGDLLLLLLLAAGGAAP